MISCFLIAILALFFDLNLNSNIIVLSIPKCGTHLLTKAVELLTNQKLDNEIIPQSLFNNGVKIICDDKKFFRSHLAYDKNLEEELIKNNFKILFIYRDPRDQVISSVYWIKKLLNNGNFKDFTYKQIIDFQIKRIPYPEVLKYETLNKQKINLDNFNFDKMITKLICQVNDYYNPFLKWKFSKNVCIVKFENLVGELGGGDNDLQRKEIKKISTYLGIQSPSLINHCMKNLYGGTKTFREGQIGSWIKYFSQKQKEIFKKKTGNLLINLDYEQNNNW